MDTTKANKVRVVIYVDQETVQKLEAIAVEQCRTVSSLAHQLLKNAVKGQGADG